VRSRGRVELSRGAYTGTGRRRIARAPASGARSSPNEPISDARSPTRIGVRIGRKAGWSPAALVCVVFLERSAAHWFVVNWWLDEIHLKKEVPM